MLFFTSIDSHIHNWVLWSLWLSLFMGFPCSSVSTESACNAGDLGLIPGLGRFPGEGNGNPLQSSYLENPIDRGAWWATVHGATRIGHDLATKPPPPAASSFFLELFLRCSPVAHWAPTNQGSSSTSVVPFSHRSWGSQGKNTEVVCHSLLQWTTFCQKSPP